MMMNNPFRCFIQLAQQTFVPLISLQICDLQVLERHQNIFFIQQGLGSVPQDQSQGTEVSSG